MNIKVKEILPDNHQNVLPKIVFLLVGILVALSLSGYIFYQSFTVNSSTVRTVSQISGNFGQKYGISHIVNQITQVSPGNNSVTIKFNVKEPVGTSLSTSMRKIPDTLSNISLFEPVNLNITAQGNTTGATVAASPIAVNLKYNAATSYDYKNGEFNKTNLLVNDLLILNVNTISVTSNPTVDNGRSNNISIVTKDQNISTDTFQNLWNKILSTVETGRKISLNNAYTISLQNVSTISGKTSFKISALVYNKKTLQLAENIGTNMGINMWNTVTQYVTSSSFSTLNIKEVDYFVSPKPTTSKVTLILADKQPKPSEVNSTITKFLATVKKDDQVSLMYSYTTAIKYADSVNDVYTNYSSNIVYN